VPPLPLQGTQEQPLGLQVNEHDVTLVSVRVAHEGRDDPSWRVRELHVQHLVDRVQDARDVTVAVLKDLLSPAFVEENASRDVLSEHEDLGNGSSLTLVPPIALEVTKSPVQLLALASRQHARPTFCQNSPL